MKKGWIIGVIILILLVVGTMYLINKNSSEKVIPNEEIECQKDLDCVKASCCHATSCVPLTEAPDCSGIYCTADCGLNTLDCGQGNCLCVKNKCSAVLK